ncbi:response regulator transcription factor [Bacillaceae bacterium]
MHDETNAFIHKKILLIDDEKDIVNLIETVLRKEGFCSIIKAGTGVEGIALCRKEQPDIVVLDVMLPDVDGFTVCQRMRQFTEVPILFLSAKGEDEDKILGLGIGGDDYITKPFSPKELAYRIKARFRRELAAMQKDEQRIYTFGDVIVNETTGEVRKGGKVVSLTAKQFQLLLHFVRNPNRIFSKTHLYEAVWGEDAFGGDNTVMVHMHQLREKLEDNPSTPRYLVTVRGLGYKLKTGDGKP